MIRRTSHGIPAGEHHFHKRGSSLRYPRLFVLRPTTWRQNFTVFREVPYRTRSVTRQDQCVTVKAPMAAEIMLGTKADLAMIVGPFFVIPAQGIAAGLGGLGVEPDAREQSSGGLDAGLGCAPALVGDHLNRKTSIAKGALKGYVEDPVMGGAVMRQVDIRLAV